MNYKIDWLVTGRLIETTFPEICTDDFLKMFDNTIIEMLDIASQPVHIIVDLHPMKQSPSASALFGAKYYKHPHMGRLIILGVANRPVPRFLSSAIGKMAGIQISNFQTMEEARVFLAALEEI